MNLIERAGGRKFVLTILFAVIIVLNNALAWGMSEESLIILAASFGVYGATNVAQKAKEAQASVIAAYEDVEEVVEEAAE